LRAHWDEIVGIARGVGFDVAPDGAYDPDAYVSVYEHALRHRSSLVLPLAKVLAVRGSAHERDTSVRELLPSEGDVLRTLALAEALARAQIEDAAARWYEA
jgi:hypothetical protein